MYKIVTTGKFKKACSVFLMANSLSLKIRGMKTTMEICGRLSTPEIITKS